MVNPQKWGLLCVDEVGNLDGLGNLYEQKDDLRNHELVSTYIYYDQSEDVTLFHWLPSCPIFEFLNVPLHNTKDKIFVGWYWLFFFET